MSEGEDGDPVLTPPVQVVLEHIQARKAPVQAETLEGVDSVNKPK